MRRNDSKEWRTLLGSQHFRSGGVRNLDQGGPGRTKEGYEHQAAKTFQGSLTRGRLKSLEIDVHKNVDLLKGQGASKASLFILPRALEAFWTRSVIRLYLDDAVDFGSYGRSLWTQTTFRRWKVPLGGCTSWANSFWKMTLRGNSKPWKMLRALSTSQITVIEARFSSYASFVLSRQESIDPHSSHHDERSEGQHREIKQEKEPERDKREKRREEEPRRERDIPRLGNESRLGACVVTYEFTRYAQVWWNQFFRKIREGKKKHVNMWVDLMQELRSTFVPASYARDLYNKLQHMY
ncbi:hypothetical protein CR513_11533, partial [Mucuna pruriens]